MNRQDGLKPFKSAHPPAGIVVMSSPEMIRKTVKAVKAGANDYLTYPIIPDEVKLVVDAIYDAKLKESELDYLRDRFWKSEAQEVLQTKNALMKQVFNKIRSVAPTKSTVLLYGETGTGKSLLAKLLHIHSNRQNAQFIAVHCGAIPDTLLESELFGHEKGAFTGAIRRKLGKFEIAKDGTIFLDEIATITPSAQVKLLQVLQDGTFSRVGGETVLNSNARVIAATNSDLKHMSENGQFRKDLYYRLNVFPIEVPTLKERLEDLPFLIETFLKRLNRELQKEVYEVHPYVMEVLKAYPWPGNIRELENLIERACILETSSMLTPESFPSELFGDDAPLPSIPAKASTALAEARRIAVEDFERQYLKDLLSRHKGRMNQSAEEAGISTRQLHKLLMKYGIKRESFKTSAP
jgi:DNA-binding NtrC family response regulator